MEKLSKKDLEARIEEYRKIYPKNTLYFTEDGNCFLSKNPAVDHATKTKQEWLEVEAAGKKEEKSDMTKDEAEGLLLELEITEKSDFKELTALAKVLDVTGKKKAELIENLLKYRETLENAE